MVTLEELYPGHPVEIRDQYGLRFEEKKEILPHQWAFHKRTPPSGKDPKFILMSGGVGSGKSTSASVEIVKLLHDYPGIEIVCVTGYDYYFDESVYPTFELVMPFDDPFVVSYNKKFRAIKCANGSTLRFKAYDDASKIKGWSCHVIWIEEASTLGDGFNEKARPIFDALMMRLRGSGNFPLRVYVTQNPRGLDWIWKLFVQKNKYGNEGLVREVVEENGKISRYKEFEYEDQSGNIYYSVVCNTAANKFLREGYLDSLKEQLRDDPQMYARMLEGDFAPINSLVYDFPYFSKDQNVLKWETFAEVWGLDTKNIAVPLDWPVYIGIDPGGAKSPWAIEKYVVTPHGELVGIDEWYKTEVTWSDAIEACHKLSEGHLNVKYCIDPIAAPAKVGPNLQSVETEFKAAGINVIRPTRYSKYSGILHVRDLLKADKSTASLYAQDQQDIEGRFTHGACKLYYIEGMCPANIAEKGVWRFDAKPMRQPRETEMGLSPLINEKPVDRDDHAQTAEIFAIITKDPAVRRSKMSHRRKQEPDLFYVTKRSARGV
jgi:PBSX family phage terminase large subunit